MPDDQPTIPAAGEPAPEAAAPRPKKKRPPRELALSPAQEQVALDIADQLQERQRGLIVKVIQHMGVDFAQALLHETLTLEAQGGLLINNGARRRTPGGVFFFLARNRMPPDLAQQVFPAMLWKELRKQTKQRKQAHRAANQAPHRQEPELPPFVWDERYDLITALLQAPGEASTVKVMLIGRPKLFEVLTDLAFITLTHPPRLDSLPRGIPRPQSGLEATYSVLIGLKQWQKVKAVLLADETDVLIIEGLYAFNEQLGGMAVYASSATTRNLQIQQRQTKKS